MLEDRVEALALGQGLRVVDRLSDEAVEAREWIDLSGDGRLVVGRVAQDLAAW